MKKPRINKHRYGFCVQLTQHMFFDMDVNDWYIIPNIEFYRKPGLSDMLVFGFLCFQLTIHRWRFDKR